MAPTQTPMVERLKHHFRQPLNAENKDTVGDRRKVFTHPSIMAASPVGRHRFGVNTYINPLF